MGTFLKVIGVIALVWFGLAAVGCSMILSAVSHGRASGSGYGSGSGYATPGGSGFAGQAARGRSDIIDAVRDDRVDLTRLPSDLTSGSSLTVTLNDGSTRTLGNTPGDRIVRALLAARMESRQRASAYPSAPDESYGASANQPHFKPGEPMLDPTPGGTD